MTQPETIREYLKQHNGKTRQAIAVALGIRESSVDRAVNEMVRKDVLIEIGSTKNDATASPARVVYIVTPYMKDRPQKNWFHLRRAGEDGRLFLLCQHHEEWLRGRLKKGEALFQIGVGTTGRPACHYCQRSVDG